MKKIGIYIFILNLNILGMEPNEKSSLLSHVTINIDHVKPQKTICKSTKFIDFKYVKTDFDLINLLPPEIWHQILDYLNIKDKKTLKTILYFFAPRIGVSKDLVKIIAVNLSNQAALKSSNFNEWEDKINNPCKKWAVLKKYEKFHQSIKNSRELIKKHLKIINNNFLEKIELYKKNKDLKQFYQSSENEIIEKSNFFQRLDYGFLEKDEQDKLKKAYLEAKKLSLLGKYQIINPTAIIILLSASLFVITLPIILSLIDKFMNHEQTLETSLIISACITIILIISWGCLSYCISGSIIGASIKSVIHTLKKNLSKNRPLPEIKIPQSIIALEVMVPNLIKSYDKVSEYQEIILEFLDSQLKENEKDKNLDKTLIADPNDTKDNLKEEE